MANYISRGSYAIPNDILVVPKRNPESSSDPTRRIFEKSTPVVRKKKTFSQEEQLCFVTKTKIATTSRRSITSPPEYSALYARLPTWTSPWCLGFFRLVLPETKTTRALPRICRAIKKETHHNETNEPSWNATRCGRTKIHSSR